MVADAVKIAITPVALIAGALTGSYRLQLDRRAGLGMQWPTRRAALHWSAAFLVLMAAEEAALRMFGAGGPHSDWRAKYDAAAIVLRVVFVCLVYPFAEELFFRGFLFGVISRKAGIAAGIVATAAFFTALHGLPSPSLGTLQIFADGIFFAFARVRSGSLVLPIGFHAVGNTFAAMQRLGWLP